MSFIPERKYNRNGAAVYIPAAPFPHNRKVVLYYGRKEERWPGQQAEYQKCQNVLERLLVFECALDDDILVKNPAKNLQVPQTEKKKRTAIEQRQIDLFMDYVKNSERYAFSYPAFVVLFNLGMRIGEMAALTWEDVDFKENTITINKTVNRYRKADYGFTMAVASPKSKTSVRSVAMNSVVRKTLLKLKMQSIPLMVNYPMWMIPGISEDRYPAFCS